MKDVELKTNEISILSYEEEDGERIYNIDENELDVQVDDKDYIFITDEGERGVREAERHHESSTPSGVYINTPKSFTWTTIGTAVFFTLTMLFNIFSVYDKQMKFNERTEEILQRHRDDILHMKDTMATKKEEDLRFQNVDVQIRRLEQLIEITQQDVDKLERK